MKKHVDLEQNLNRMAKACESVHEDIEALVQDAEVEKLIVKRVGNPGGSDFKVLDDEEQTVVGMSSTRFIDRDNEIVIPKGVDLSHYVKAPVKLWNHNWDQPPIGKNTAIKATNKGLIAKTVIGGTEFANEIWKAVSFGSLNTSSISFIPTKVIGNGTAEFGKLVDKLTKAWPEFDFKIADQVSSIIAKSILLEDSLVSVPANIDATIMAVSDKSLDIRRKSLEAMGFEVEIVETERDLEDIYAELSVKSAEGCEQTPPIGEDNSQKDLEIEPDLSKTMSKLPRAKVLFVRQDKVARMKRLQEKLIDEAAWQVRKAAGHIR